jgi:WD40 repeat protein
MRWNTPAPGERDAQERAWKIVRSAWAEREPVARRRAVRRWPVLAFAAGLAILAAALSPPGMAVLGSLKDAVRGEPNARPALFALPAPGRLLIASSRGVWVVQQNGTKRLLRGYRDPAWSPHGLFLAAIHGHELRAIEPTGAEHWSLARSGRLRFPVWSDATPPCCRIAYLSGTTLRVVNGDSTDDRLLAAGVAPVAPVWRPGTHQLAYVRASGQVRVVNADTRRTVSTWTEGTPKQLAWSPDGRVVAGRTSEGPIWVYRPDGFRVVGISTQSVGPGRPFSSIAFAPRGETLTYVAYDPTADGSVVFTTDLKHGEAERRIFAGAGRFGGTTWSSDGRWLVLDWDSADELLFVRSPAVRRIVPVSHVGANFGSDASLAGWCCP